ncbi:hypothetical protein CDEST_13731 [Colletotrichum destructivum]|uniref:Uncharacterized protein n=1 Tax=Colletotrichum destructivum TaxID=34406 RepID=A0AAX4IZM5_9PEZI|nr:hypothetical protein CDEST_13731 [Colletotrichum destructivum]
MPQREPERSGPAPRYQFLRVTPSFLAPLSLQYYVCALTPAYRQRCYHLQGKRGS